MVESHGNGLEAQNDLEEVCVGIGLLMGGEENVVQNEEVDSEELEDLDVELLTPTEFRCLKFKDPEIAYNVYNQYAKANGFGVRRSKIGRNRKKKVLWVRFVCNREGVRDEKYVNNENRKRDQRPITRCGCLAELRIHIDDSTQLWYVVAFCDDHNHGLVGHKFSSRIRSHRKMSDADIAQVNSMRMSGISTPKNFGSFSVQSGCDENIGFGLKSVYNLIEKERRAKGSDFDDALNYLRELQINDPMFFWRHSVSDDGTFLHLFWSDGSCRLDYELFGDVLAFDATYGRNKYKCPVVVFSGVNHHNQTCVFGCAIVTNEIEETYVWLLEQFLQAMNGKRPTSVITDGDVAMRNAISRVFPEAHHRLCVWHLLRNATTNLHKPYFTKQLKKCMIGDYEVFEFEERFKTLVEECALVENNWVQLLYEKKTMWATAYMRGKFFAGLTTTSRCEGLHAFVGRFVLRGYNFIESIQHFQRALEKLRTNELDADFKSSYGEQVLITEFQSIERFVSQVFTLNIFKLIRGLIVKLDAVRILDVRETMSGKIFVVGKYREPDLKWHVSYYSTANVFKCSCRRMESMGVPCVHTLKVLTELDMDELPSCLVLDRWRKDAKDKLAAKYGERNCDNNLAANMIRYGGLVHSCRDMCKLACIDTQDYNDIREMVEKQRQRLKKKYGHRFGNERPSIVRVKDPNLVNRGAASSSSKKRKRGGRCTICRVEGHNRSTCPFQMHLQRHLDGGSACHSSAPQCGDNEEVDENINLGND